MLTAEDDELTACNTQLTSVKHYIKIRDLILHESAKINQLKCVLKKPFWFHLGKRIFYFGLWLYILYYCPYPIIIALIYGFYFYYKKKYI